jgi:hypothetical protein
MSKRATGQHWYQVHKAKAGQRSVDESKAVRAALKLVQEAEAEVSRCSLEVSESFGSGVRRLIFGLNAHENLLQQAIRRLEAANAAAAKAEADARRQGEKAYSDDWVSRNPDKIRRT